MQIMQIKLFNAILRHEIIESNKKSFDQKFKLALST